MGNALGTLGGTQTCTAMACTRALSLLLGCCALRCCVLWCAVVSRFVSSFARLFMPVLACAFALPCSSGQSPTLQPVSVPVRACPSSLCFLSHRLLSLCLTSSSHALSLSTHTHPRTHARTLTFTHPRPSFLLSRLPSHLTPLSSRPNPTYFTTALPPAPLHTHSSSFSFSHLAPLALRRFSIQPRAQLLFWNSNCPSETTRSRLPD